MEPLTLFSFEEKQADGTPKVLMKKWIKTMYVKLFCLSNNTVHMLFYSLVEVLVSFKGTSHHVRQ